MKTSRKTLKMRGKMKARKRTRRQRLNKLQKASGANTTNVVVKSSVQAQFVRANSTPVVSATTKNGNSPQITNYTTNSIGTL